ncbi:NMDA receptor-regulated protein 1-domain-containing protein [Chytriomyces sp. MP71]|nr:NMDA receptor-regulated protein 1-domain-containing protein [Chytriomyces sp. MP71]
MPPKVVLPAKEQALMREVAKLHDQKLHKKGLKTCETILKKYPEHGEAIAFKALFLSGLERKEEAHETVKRAIKVDITNHVCWHAYGLIWRAEKNYEECIKCYSQALKIDKENINIYRDFASMQMQLRHTEAFLDACLSILLLRPQYKPFWLALAASFHVAGNKEGALQALDNYDELFKPQLDKSAAYETSEVIMYRAMLHEEKGDLKAALDAIDSNEKFILDKKSAKQARARLLLALGETKQAEVAYKTLFKLNPDNYAALEGLQRAKGLFGPDFDAIQTAKLFELFEDLLEEHRRSNTIKRVPLNYASGDKFTKLADSFLRFNFQKGVPSLFMSVRALYTDPEKQATVERLCLAYVTNLQVHGQFAAPQPHEDEEEDEVIVVEPPSALLWVYYYLAQHYDFVGDAKKAVEFVDKAIAHTPTLVELFMTKARILKHAGDMTEAMEVMNYARNLDLQDRCINTKCTKYMLRAGEIAEAEKTIVLFCRVDSLDKLQDLVDMQASWFAYEYAMACISKGEYGKALKRFHQIEKFFYDIYDDQFDFHTYSIRKTTLRTYMDLVRMEDQLRAHPFYFRAAVQAVRLYLHVHEVRTEGDARKEAEMSQMSEADRKKALRKARKAEMMGSNENVVPGKGAASPAAAAPAAAAGKKKDDDPDGAKLLAAADLLEESLRFLRPLLELSPGRVESQVLGAAVYAKKKKYVLAVKCLHAGYKIDATNPELHKLAMDIAAADFIAKTAEPNDKVKAVVQDTLKVVLGSSVHDLAAFNAGFAKKHTDSLSHAVSVAEAALTVDSDAVSRYVDAVVAISGKNGYKLDVRSLFHNRMLQTLMEPFIRMLLRHTRACSVNSSPANPRSKRLLKTVSKFSRPPHISKPCKGVFRVIR